MEIGKEEVTAVKVQEVRATRIHVLDWAGKLRALEKVFGDMVVQMHGYGSERFAKTLNAMRKLRDVMAMDCDMDLFCRTSRCPVVLPLPGTNVSRLVYTSSRTTEEAMDSVPVSVVSSEPT
ncbi:unnamed protein product [Dicrocoelium dendriticum]|nr:unnamed protein product [Dicrocoelium dendriticum]